ncbi:MAG TPA: hypothetical protein VL727_14680 [Puia sp.]|jgi:hypothetical protein|nr:hypothetical protein [Puia sp.]
MEKDRLKIPDWKLWGPYVSDRQWGTVREDYSADGQAWTYTTHDMAASKAWRWGEEGIGGISDKRQRICFSVGLWNKKDPIIKDKLFGLTGYEGNHGEDVKELYYYLDSSPTHSYMKMLYKYPQEAFPYDWLVKENKKRTREQPEFELMDTGIFDEDKYFDVFIEYAKADMEDILVRITVHNRGKETAPLHILPTIWFRNTWSWGNDDYKPRMMTSNEGDIILEHRELGEFTLYGDETDSQLFCDNETNMKKLYGVDRSGYFKDGVQEYIIHRNEHAVNYQQGTKAVLNYEKDIPGGGSVTIRLRLQNACNNTSPFHDFDEIFATRIKETDDFYAEVQADMKNEDEKMVQRQAFSGMLWNKQLYYFNVEEWLKGDPAQPPPSPERLKGRNREWNHLKNSNIISMPDKWEYPWYAAWDLGFHCIIFALIDADFAKHQLMLLTHDWYMHPNGQLPAYEWAFGDTNPPVHAWAAYRVYEIDKHQNGGKGDIIFLETVFHKLLLNFTWWVNRKDEEGNNIFEGGFLGMDNIGVFDRNMRLPDGSRLEQADGTSWVATYSLNLMRIALELSMMNPVYQDMANKFFEHFLHIAAAMASLGTGTAGLWDNDDEFYYDTLRLPADVSIRMRIRSMVGLVPMFAVEVIDDELLQSLPEFAKRLKWLFDHRPDLAALVSRWHEKGSEEKHLLSLLRGHRIKRILYRMLDEMEFLSDFGVRSLSKYHEKHPYELLKGDGTMLTIKYTPAESNVPLFGGNSNWRGPVWTPVNFLLIESLQRFHHYYGDDFKIEYPTHSGKYYTLNEISEELSMRMAKLFLRDPKGLRPVFGANEKMQHDPHFRDYILFYEYFDGDTGKGLGASHQTGWTGLVAKLLQPRKVVPTPPAEKADENK